VDYLAADFVGEIIFYQWDGDGEHRRIQEKEAHFQDDIDSALLWKNYSTTVKNADVGHFDDSGDTGLLRFCISTATVYICQVEQEGLIFCSLQTTGKDIKTVTRIPISSVLALT
jgi:hypothetical protein